MKIEATVDTSELLRKLPNGERRMAYAVVNAINTTAKQIQQAEFDQVRREFIVRKPGFLFGTPARPGGVVARIKPFASVGQGRAYAIVQTGAEAVNGRQRVLLPQFETGGERQPSTPGARRTAIPLLGRPARPAINRGVPYEYSFAGLKLTAYVNGVRQVRERRGRKSTGIGLYPAQGHEYAPGATTRMHNLERAFDAVRGAGEGEGTTVQYKGRNRTFLLTRSRNAPEGGVFQRIGPGRGDVRMIYAFRTHVQLDARLQYQATALSVADRWYRENLEKETLEAMRRAGFRTA